MFDELPATPEAAADRLAKTAVASRIVGGLCKRAESGFLDRARDMMNQTGGYLAGRYGGLSHDTQSMINAGLVGAGIGGLGGLGLAATGKKRRSLLGTAATGALLGAGAGAGLSALPRLQSSLNPDSKAVGDAANAVGVNYQKNTGFGRLKSNITQGKPDTSKMTNRTLAKQIDDDDFVNQISDAAKENLPYIANKGKELVQQGVAAGAAQAPRTLNTAGIAAASPTVLGAATGAGASMYLNNLRADADAFSHGLTSKSTPHGQAMNTFNTNMLNGRNGRPPSALGQGLILRKYRKMPGYAGINPTIERGYEAARHGGKFTLKGRGRGALAMNLASAVLGGFGGHEAGKYMAPVYDTGASAFSAVRDGAMGLFGNGPRTYVP